MRTQQFSCASMAYAESTLGIPISIISLFSRSSIRFDRNHDRNSSSLSTAFDDFTVHVEPDREADEDFGTARLIARARKEIADGMVLGVTALRLN